MLGRLIQGYGKGNAGLESATEEQHSRSLLWPQQVFEPGRGPGASPPGTPVGSPSFRVGPYDDRGGLELNESKDARMIIAQDAFGGMDKPMVLFDSHRRDPNGVVPPMSHGKLATTPTSPRPSRLQQSFKVDPHQRNRSTTISGPSSTWARSAKDPEGGDRVSQLLECMFGVTSATKSESSTKMHVLFSVQDGAATQTQSGPLSPSKTSSGRTPLLRSHTSSQVPATQKFLASPKEDSSFSQDTVLVTRMFSVSLPDSKEQPPSAEATDAGSQGPESPLTPVPSPSDARGGLPSKKPKLVEKKTPMFAIGFLFYLPPAEQRINPARPPSRTSFASSLPNSYNSDIASSWTLLEAIPESLASSQSLDRSTDRRVEFITNIWDVILRSLSSMEQLARTEIQLLLQQVNREMMTSLVKAPKGPHEQRTNQRNIYIRNPSALSHVAVIDRSCRHILRRICYALRIPRVVTGIGFVDGHWLDEARYLVQICGLKQQHFFLFNLLTAFLGNHTEWLERLSPEWYKKQFNALNKNRQSITSLASRTVIIADRRSVARRLIFLLASFLPTRHGLNALDKDSLPLRSPLATPSVSMSSPLNNGASRGLSQLGTRHKSRGQHVSFGAADAIGLSTSASSTGSAALSSSAQRDKPHHYFARKDSDTLSVRTTSMLPIANVHGSLRKTSATNSTITPNPATPVPFFSTKQESYFPQGVIAENADSVASADLARILRRDSSSYAHSSGPSTAWGSLISNMSGLWIKKNEPSGDSNPNPPPSAGTSGVRRLESSPSITTRAKPTYNKLEAMVSESAGIQGRSSSDDVGEQSQITRNNETNDELGSNLNIEPPRLRVDDKDGVVDVDVGMHGFLSWADSDTPLSPPAISHKTPSIKSLDGVNSIYSSKSIAASRTQDNTPEGVNVAGFLKRYHEDFSLQAVVPYDELDDQIRQSMSRETTPCDNSNFQGRETQHESDDGEWITVCSTLIADMRKFSIQRLILRRKKAPRPNSAIERLQNGDDLSNPMSQPVPEEQFLSESVGDFDTTLTDAIESILGVTNRVGQDTVTSKPLHSRTVSADTTSTARSTPPSSSLTSIQRPVALRADCRQIVAGALEQVVRSVNDDLNKHQKGRDIHGHNSFDQQAIREEMKQENVLREGVKQWLLNVETRSVW